MKKGTMQQNTFLNISPRADLKGDKDSLIVKSGQYREFQRKKYVCRIDMFYH